MKLKKLELSGFKSFYDKTSIDFPAGISAIVGPNGCGKSNVMDALKWVMGEQSLKQLRGKSKEDIIFAGADGKQPLNFAEVNLLLANDNGSAPEELKDYAEIMVTRRLYRSGESMYMLNKQQCRLKDIYNVFLGSGMGAKSYAVIQQGNIGAITEAGPEERRAFVEEAAGTTRYKTRKIEALRKIKSTNDNLLRLNDIIVEIERQMKGLKRQAQKAERFRKYREELKDLEIRLGLIKHRALSGEIVEADTLLNGFADDDIAHDAKLKQIDAAVEEIKLKRTRKSEEISSRKSQLFENQRSADRIENQLSHSREEIERLREEGSALTSAKAGLEQRIREIASEIEEAEQQTGLLQQESQDVKLAMEKERKASDHLRTHLGTLRKHLDDSKSKLMDLVAQEARYKNIYQTATSNQENLKRRLKRKDEEELLARKQVRSCEHGAKEAKAELEELHQELADLEEQIETVKKNLDEKSQALGQQVKTVQQLEYERNQVGSKYAALKKMEDNFEWYRDGVKALLKAQRKAIEDPGDGSAANAESGNTESGHPENSHAIPIEGLLADVIEAEPEYEPAVEAILGEALQYVLVKDQTGGREGISFLQTHANGRSGFIPLTQIKPVAPPGASAPALPRLMEHITVKPGFDEVAQALLGHVVIAGSVDEALDIFNRNGKIQSIVTRDGDVVSHQGIMIGGSKEKLSGLLAKKKELRDLKQQIEDLKTRLEQEHQHQQQLESEVRGVETELQQLFASKQQASQDEVAAEKKSYKTEEDLKNARRNLELVRLEQEQLMGEEMDINEELSGYNQALTRISAEVQDAQKSIAAGSGEIDTVSTKVETYDKQLVDLRLRQTNLTARLDNNENTLRRLKDFHADAASRFGQLETDISLKNRRREELEQQIVKHENSLKTYYSNIEGLGKVLEEAENTFNEYDTNLRENEEVVSDIRAKREEILKKIRLLELEQSQRKIKRDNIASRLFEKYHKSLGELQAAFAGRLEAEEEPVQKLETEIERYQKRIDSIGNVNLGAIDEYEELDTRHNFLMEQREDLIKAVADLQKVIRKINRITQKRFLETLEKVNEKLEEVFPRLFEGGSAKLIMTDPDTPLETGVEYMIQPPGKKLTRISLLSGGEKALSAIAFVFSIFLIKPASFCLLDEIDAPLDDANNMRFNQLLKMIGEKSQIIMITHNKRSMEFADMLFGITMEKKGVSKVVSVNFDYAA
jgi:chromosome segregation protein